MPRHPTKPTSRLLGGLLVVVATVAIAGAQVLIEENDSVARPFDAKATLPPLSPEVEVAATAMPSVDPSAAPMVPVPVFPTKPTNPVNIVQIDCGELGASQYTAATCPANKMAGDLTMENTGTIPFDVFYVRPNDALILKRSIGPGDTTRVSSVVCVGDKYIVRDYCGVCMYAVRITDTTAQTVSVMNPTNEDECPGQSRPKPTPVSATGTMFEGTWDPLVNWEGGLIPVAMANVPGSNKVLGIAAVKTDKFRNPVSQPTTYTEATLYDPDTGRFQERDLNGHDIFCAGFTLLPDGRLLAVGGGQEENSFKVSTFDPFASQWARHLDTELGHWYGTAVLTKDDSVLIALGTDKLVNVWEDTSDFPELSDGFNFDRPWKNMSRMDLSGKGPDRTHWYPQLHLMSNGQILESGTQNAMYRLDTNFRGRVISAGNRNKRRNELESWGSFTIMYAANKLLAVGGIENWRNDGQPNTSVFQRVIDIDMTNPTRVKTKLTGELAYPRAFPNLVVLPSGQVLAIGGKDNVYQWDDTMSVYNAEIWDPVTGEWTLLAAQEKPRNYHSAAILLKDGRVLSGGGGLCGSCNGNSRLNHPNSQIFNPPYLFDATGTLKPRPIIVSSRATALPDEVIRIIVRGANFDNITRVSLVKQASVTHSLSTDVRQLELDISRTVLRASRAVYEVRTLSNLNIMTPGYYFLFVLDQTGTPSIATEIQILRP